MKIIYTGKYRLLNDMIARGTISTGTLKAGTEFNVTQIDNEYHKVYSPEFGDWIYHNIPAEKVEAQKGREG